MMSFLELFVIFSLLFFAGEAKLWRKFKNAAKEEDDISFYMYPRKEFSNVSYDVISDDFFKCFSKLSYDVSMRENVKKSTESSAINKISESHSLFYMMGALSQLISSINIDLSIIEPSILFCLLPRARKELLLRRKFNFTHFSAHDNLISLGIFAKDAPLLEKEETKENFRAAGFQPFFAKSPIADWMVPKNATAKSSEFISHIFYSYEKFLIHIVVFYNRSNYLWHQSLPSSSDIPSIQDIVFFKDASAYDNFEFIPANLDLLFPHSEFSIPTRPDYFLFQIQHSRFLECNKSIVAEFKNKTSEKDRGDRASESAEKFVKRTVIAIRQLKYDLSSLLMNHWIWSGTMLGWHRQCDIIPYTSDVDFGAWADEVDDVDELLKMFSSDNKPYKIRERYGIPERGLEFNLNCHGLRVDVFFLYPESNGTWYAGHRPSKGYYFKYHHPSFTLCSCDLLGEKVTVPCETEKCISAEYGPEWMKPVSSWNYESSIKNRGPNIYWPKELEGKTYTGY
ncbi:ribitol-5-phosphate transferase FKTN-like isoform X2 [Uloborus diversus]|uniref:ribitol-5-phosphate transferase FKTN-like isoform X2 n=1 Tax=Uloborus diversus TaxID=327109 RepID=UPI002409CDAD|nr:ribitol-5-phosphate transferase FKTN-like isoform X2 [Uloborus diversus]